MGKWQVVGLVAIGCRHQKPYRNNPLFTRVWSTSFKFVVGFLYGPVFSAIFTELGWWCHQFVYDSLYIPTQSGESETLPVLARGEARLHQQLEVKIRGRNDAQTKTAEWRREQRSKVWFKACGMMTYTKCVPLRLNAMFILYCWRVMFSVDITFIINIFLLPSWERTYPRWDMWSCPGGYHLNVLELEMFLDCTLQQSASWIHRSAWKSWPPPSNLSKEWSRNVRAQGIDMFTGVIDYWFGGYWYWMVLDDCTRDHCSVIRYAIVGIKLPESSWKNNKSTRMNSVIQVALCVVLFSSQVGHSRQFFLPPRSDAHILLEHAFDAHKYCLLNRNFWKLYIVKPDKQYRNVPSGFW